MKINSLVIFLIFTVVCSYGQDRVKGSRVVTDVSERLPTFTKVNVTDGLEITLLKSGTEGYDLEMDDNLVELINMDVKDSILTVSLRKTIRSSKKLDITVRFNEISEIQVDQKARVTSQSVIETPHFKGAISGNGFLQAEIKAPEGSFTINESSKLELDYRGDRLSINASDNAFALGDINTEEFDLVASGRSDIDFKGNALETVITLDETADFKGKTFDSDAVKVILRGSSKATLSVDKDILIDMSDKSTLNLYGEPSITIERFSGTSTLQKKE